MLVAALIQPGEISFMKGIATRDEKSGAEHNGSVFSKPASPRNPRLTAKLSAEDLVRRLVAEFSIVNGKNQTREEISMRTNGQVLADVEVDGIRCLLIWKGITQHSPRSLSPREQEIARMIAAGYPNKTIAGVLDISSWTVGTHLRRIFLKLGVSCRAAMVAKLADAQVCSLSTRPRL